MLDISLQRRSLPIPASNHEWQAAEKDSPLLDEIRDEIQPEAVWLNGSLFVVAPDGRQYPTDIRLKEVSGTDGSSGVRQVRFGGSSMWGQPKVRLFPCDASAFGQEGLAVGGLAVTRYMVMYFEMILRNKADSLVFCGAGDDSDLHVGGLATDDRPDTECRSEPREFDPFSVSEAAEKAMRLWSSKDNSGSVRCTMSRCEQDRIAVSCLADDHGCVIYMWERKATAEGGWGWARMGAARFILPFDVPRSFIDHLRIQDNAIVIRQADRPDLRIAIDLHTSVGIGLTQEVRWTYGDAVWKLCSPPPDEHSVTMLASRLDRRVSLLYMDNSLPGLSDAWERVIMGACRSCCTASELQPVYIEFLAHTQIASLESILHAIPVEKAFLIIHVKAPASSAMPQDDGRQVSAYVKNFFEQVKNTLDLQDMQCVVMAPHIAADTAYKMLSTYASRLLGPYTEMLDDTVAALVGRDIVPHGRETTEAYCTIRDHYLRHWEEDDDGEMRRESETAGVPFRLPVPRVRQLLAEAAADKDGAQLSVRVATRIARTGGQGSSAVSAETKQALSNLPLIIRGLESGGGAMYGQDKSIRLTQRHLQAHLLRMDEGRPTFAFFVGANGLGKTTLARQSIREIGGVLEEINCSSLDNAYGYGEYTSDKLMKAVETVRMSPRPFKAILLDEVDKNIDVLKALIRLTDSDTDDAHSLLEHPLAGIFVFITMNVLPDQEQYKSFTGESDPQAKMEKLRDLVVASVKGLTADTKVIHAIVSRLLPYLVFFDDLSATDSRGRHHVASLIDDEIQDFSKRHGTRIVIDEDTLPEFTERLSTVTVGGFRSVRSMVRREIESAVGAALARNEHQLGEDETIILRESDGELEAVDAGEGGPALYKLATMQYTRISTAVRRSLDRLLETMRLRDGDRFELDSQEVLAVSYRKLSEQPLFAVKGSEASFSYNEAEVVGASRSRDIVRELSDAIDTMHSGMEEHCRTLSDAAARGTADEAARALVADACRVYRLALPKSVQADGIANQDNLRKELPEWIKSAWEVYVDAEKRRKVLKENARNALKDFSSEWDKLVEDQDDIAGDVRKVPQIRAKAFREGLELRDTIVERSKESGLADRTLRQLLDKVIDASLANEKLDEDKVLEELELSAKEERPMSVHLLRGAAVATLIDKMVRDMLGNEYEVAKRRQTSLEKG